LAHTWLAFLELWYYWDFESAGKEFRIVNQLTPSYFDVDDEFTQYLLVTGKFDDAFKVSKENFDNSDISQGKYVSLALAYTYNGQQEKALETVETYLHIFQINDYLLYNSIRIYTISEKYEKVLELYDKYLSAKSPDHLSCCFLGWIGIAFIKTGRESHSSAFLHELASINRKPFTGSPSYFAAALYTAMNEKEKALQSLQKAYNDRELDMAWLKVDPLFRPLHGDPRFKNILTKMGFK
jgi:tetratricopeptide (TPR) repeat protein